MMKQVKDLLDQVQYRLGMQKDSTGWLTQRPVVVGMVESALMLLTEEYRNRMRFVPNVLLVPAERGHYDEPETISTYHVPENCDPTRIEALSANWSGIWHQVPKGISQGMRNSAYVANPTFTGWDIVECNKIEVFPHPEEWHQVRISYTKTPTQYDDEESCLDMDPQLLLHLALDIAIPFYGRPDAEMNNRHLNRHLGNLRAKELTGIRFTKGAKRGLGGTPDAADAIYNTVYNPR